MPPNFLCCCIAANSKGKKWAPEDLNKEKQKYKHRTFGIKFNAGIMGEMGSVFGDYYRGEIFFNWLAGSWCVLEFLLHNNYRGWKLKDIAIGLYNKKRAYDVQIIGEIYYYYY